MSRTLQKAEVPPQDKKQKMPPQDKKQKMPPQDKKQKKLDEVDRVLKKVIPKKVSLMIL